MKATIDGPRFLGHESKAEIAAGAVQVTSDDWMRIGDDGTFYHGCCDCGLAHVVHVKTERGETFVRFQGDDELTDEYRKVRDFPLFREGAGNTTEKD